ncbi:kinesin-like protein KIN-5B [Silene latifolia]|uniref:kinesin-like protein KIN-5B n=1 Tax=Silene latifolia TaxID=37657 RepID=UPI003D782685
MEKMVSMTPDQFRKVGMGVVPSPSPFFTPRPERFRVSLRGSEARLSSFRQDKDNEVNVQVVLRCRPLSDDEQRTNPSKVIACHELKREVVVSQSVSNKQVDRVFTFDKVFGPKAQQRSIYEQAIAPIVRDVLDGYDCTVFAYGQTGTGKTYTMEGVMRSKGGEMCDEAGVIPRAVRQIFDMLEAQNADYSMKVSSLELYNEEITDLLAREDMPRYLDDKPKKSVLLMEDGKGCVTIRGLEEEVVYSANDIYKLMERGASKRRNSDTLLNKRSSRSHSIFTIMVYVKEMVGNEELIKCGKLNLVDLAGSENVSRSGVREGRAREVGEINKSLLTLGRVINALVDHSAHIPYRDSKLTRLLRDSLGGKTKTCIIATISPSGHCLEETLSTLDYAYRAKNIKNKPEANQKMSKSILLKELYMELERMKQDVRAAREKNGVYISHERFAQDEADKKGRNEKIEQLQTELELSRKDADKYRRLYLCEQEVKMDVELELQDCKKKLESASKICEELEENHKLVSLQVQEKEYIISKLLNSENNLIQRAKEMRSKLENASADITALHMKIDEKNKLETQNHKLVLTLGSQLDQSLKDLHKTILGSVSQQQDQLKSMDENLCSFLASKDDAVKNLESKIQKIADTHTSTISGLREFSKSTQRKTSEDFEYINAFITCQSTDAEKLLGLFVVEAKDVLDELQNSLSVQKELLHRSAVQQEQGLQRTLASAEVITKATRGFFDEICSHASKIMGDLERSQSKNHEFLINFEERFKEVSATEEKRAIEKIVSALAALTTNKATLVSEALRNINERRSLDNKVCQQSLSKIQEVSLVANTALNEHMESAESHFLTDLYLLTEMGETKNQLIGHCSDKVNYAQEQWKRAQHSLNDLNNERKSKIQAAIIEKQVEVENIQNQYVTSVSAKDAEFDANMSSLLLNIKDSYLMDCETKNKMNSFSSQCLSQLTSLQTEHDCSLSNIRNKAELCLIKDYLVDSHVETYKREMHVPSLASIEEMRTPDINDLVGRISFEECMKRCQIEPKTVQHSPRYTTSSLDRAPFANIN